MAWLWAGGEGSDQTMQKCRDSFLSGSLHATSSEGQGPLNSTVYLGLVGRGPKECSEPLLGQCRREEGWEPTSSACHGPARQEPHSCLSLRFFQGLGAWGKARSNAKSLPAVSQLRPPHVKRHAGKDAHRGGRDNGVTSAAGAWVAEGGVTFHSEMLARGGAGRLLLGCYY